MRWYWLFPLVLLMGCPPGQGTTPSCVPEDWVLCVEGGKSGKRTCGSDEALGPCILDTPSAPRSDAGMLSDGGRSTDGGNTSDGSDGGSCGPTQWCGTGSTSGSSRLAGTCGGDTAPEDVYQWTPASSGRATISTCGSDFDTVLYVRSGAEDGPSVACNDDFSSCGSQSQVTIDVVAGTTYYVVVDGHGTALGSYILTVTPPSVCSCSGKCGGTDDGCGGTCNASCPSGQVCQGQICASTCIGDPTQACGNCGTQSRTCNNGVWGTWGTCTGQGVCSASTLQNCGDGGTGGTRTCDPATCQWTACVTCVGNPTQPCSNCGTQNRTCYNGVWGAWSTCAGQGACPAGTTQSCPGGTQTCTSQCQWGTCVPTGPCGSNAVQTVSPGGGTATGSTSGSSSLTGTCGGTAPESVYQWTPASSGRATISTCGSAFDTVLYVHSGACNGPSVACNDDFSSCGSQSQVTIDVVAGTTYYIVVDGFGTTNYGSYILTVTPPSVCNCSGKCGGVADGCGGTCNASCPSGQVCQNQTCVTCSPNCGGKCGGAADGCGVGGTCNASCPSGQVCQNQLCGMCSANCSGKCGGATDGCTGTCNGSCPSGYVCQGQTCAGCSSSCTGKCGGTADGCGGTCNASCPSGQVCQNQTCVTCSPNCSGKCGGSANGCGGTCNGSCPSGYVCQGQTCVCSPSCSGK